MPPSAVDQPLVYILVAVPVARYGLRHKLWILALCARITYVYVRTWTLLGMHAINGTVISYVCHKRGTQTFPFHVRRCGYIFGDGSEWISLCMRVVTKTVVLARSLQWSLSTCSHTRCKWNAMSNSALQRICVCGAVCVKINFLYFSRWILIPHHFN